MNTLRIVDVERTWVHVPLKPRHDRHLTRENWNWPVMEVLRVSTNSELVGIGETMCYYSWGRVPQAQVERVKGRSPFELLWDARLGAGLQMAMWDLAGKAMGVPCYQLMGSKVRDWCPIAWWSMDMSLEDWQEEMQEAVAAGYMAAKLKARPWRDFATQMATLSKIVPAEFTIEGDFNDFLRTTTLAVAYLRELEQVPNIVMHESPLPQGDVEANATVRRRIERPIAMHYGNPSLQVVVRDEVCDGFVIGGDAATIRRHAGAAAEVNKPFFLQMVGTGLTTALMLHFGATLTHAIWPAVTCLNIYTDDLITEPIVVKQGYAHVPEKPGLGVELDEDAVARFKRPEGYEPEPPRTLYRVSWPSGNSIIYPPGKDRWYDPNARGVWDDFLTGTWPLFSHGVRLDNLPDDGSPAWEALRKRATVAPVRE
ncbi:MAG: enolase [Chloroflexi bacterium]|nr:enolase [Chloroflexota bacterium]